MLTPHRYIALLGALLLTLLTVGLPVPAGAAGGGGSEGASSPAKPEDPQYTSAVKAIKANEYAKAIPLLQGVVSRDDKNADAYNWLAYATRKTGDAAASLPLYEKALAIDPKHKGAHEYIGEAYLMVGNVAKAKEHLSALDRLCFFGCDEYALLKKAVAEVEAKAK